MNDHVKTTSGPIDTQQITIHLPCKLAERAAKYAKENGNTITGVVIERWIHSLEGRR